jgi:predicted nucleotidyltransferase
MVSLIAQYRDELEELCRRYHVRRLELFGSATSGEFYPNTSDLDFLVLFDELEPAIYADAYLGFYESLTTLFDRRIELVSTTAITNPYFLESIQRNRETLYAA